MCKKNCSIYESPYKFGNISHKHSGYFSLSLHAEGRWSGDGMRRKEAYDTKLFAFTL